MSRREREERLKKQTAKKTFVALGVILAIGLLGFGLFKLVSSQPQISESDIISREGIHWHPELQIYIKGVKQIIPANIGIGITHQPIHTHETDGIIHLEIQGFVTKNDIKLGRFFAIWGKTFNTNCIFEYCNGPEGQLKMIVNGLENHDFENYVMRHEDRIEIRYE